MRLTLIPVCLTASTCGPADNTRFDPAGTVVATIPLNDPTENYVEECVDDGVITFIAIHAQDPMSAPKDYTTLAIEDF